MAPPIASGITDCKQLFIYTFLKNPNHTHKIHLSSQIHYCLQYLENKAEAYLDKHTYRKF